MTVGLAGIDAVAGEPTEEVTVVFVRGDNDARDTATFAVLADESPSDDGSGDEGSDDDGSGDGGSDEPSSDDPGDDAQRQPPPACPDGDVPDAGFTDTAGNPHADNIDCVAWYHIAQGTGPDTYSPAAVRRDQMATFLARTLERAAQDGHVTPPS